MEDPDAASPQPAMDDPGAASLHAAMEVPITASLGLRKLHSLMAPEHSLPDGLTADKISPLRDGLKVLCNSLKNLSEAEDASFTAKWWMKIVRELCYDTEDHLDEVIREPCYDTDTEDDLDEVMLSGAGAHQIASEKASDFSELIARVENALSFIPDCGEAGVSGLTPQLSLELPVPISVHVDTGGCSIVGVEEPVNKLVDLLAFNDDNWKQLKVVPIFGFAGVGKTTVARTLYHKYGGKFQCRAFVGVSRNPDMRRLLTSMLSQIKAPRPHGFPDVTDLIDGIRKHLQGKRYFIIMDDLWTASAWDIISRAFPHGDYCSRIITTTQIDDVAMACCSYYREHRYAMSPLNDDESRKLFFGRVFGSEDGCPTDIKEVSYEIIRKCGGLPLAIVHIASLLASEPNIVRKKLKHVQDSLSSTSEGMKDVLNVIYNSLPPRLKTCLLYLSMYPEGYPIGKHDLVKQWIAEGFLSGVEGRDTEQLAEVYFDELVSRGMVQAVDTNYNDEVLSCTVHHMVLDLIRHKSMQENFIISVDYFQSTLSLPDKVRRLSVQFGGAKGAKIPESIVISHVRSLIFSGFLKCVPPIVEYRFLGVLALHIWADQDKASFDLTRICELFRLRYLKIECNITVDLPDKIQGLQHLRTLQIDARLSAVPSDIGRLKKLLHLCLPSQANLPAGIGHMTSLRSLGYFNLSYNSRDNVLPAGIGHMTSLRSLGYFNLSNNSSYNVLDLGKLINLWDLRLTCSTVESNTLVGNIKHLVSILGKLSKLKSLILDAGASSSSISWDGLNSVSPAPAVLERLEMPGTCIFPSLPRWFGELHRLCILKIAVSELSREDIDILKGLDALTALSLYVWITPTGGIVFGKEGFGALRYFKFTCTAPCLTFEKDAMPNVQRLKLRFNANRLEQYDPVRAGFEHLLGLEEISAKIGSVSTDEYDSIAALWMNVFSKIPSSPIFNMQSVDRIFQELHICGHGGPSCPTWLGDELVIEALQSLHLVGVSWEVFPSLGKTRDLRELTLEHIATMKEFVIEQSFCRLIRLTLIGLGSFEKWVPGAVHLFPLLQVLIIRDCPKLLELPLSNVYPLKQDGKIDWFPKLQQLEIQMCPEFSSVIPIFWTETLCSVKIEGVKLLKKFEYSKSSSDGVKLSISGKDDLHSLDQVLVFNKETGLEELTLTKCPPLELRHLLMLTSLKRLVAWSCDGLIGPQGSQGDVKWQLPVECLEVHSCDATGRELTELLAHLPRLSSLVITWCGKITQLVVGVDLQKKTSTTSDLEEDEVVAEAAAELTVEQKEEDGVLLFPPNLSDSLRDLNIEHCEELVLMAPPTLLPDAHNEKIGGGWPRCLQSITIYYCPKFLSACWFSLPSCRLFPSSLQTLDLGGVEGMARLEVDFSYLTSLTRLKLNFGPTSKTHLVCSSSSRLFPSSLQDLELWEVEGMGTLEPLSNLTSLSRLVMIGCGPDLRCEGLLPLLTTGGHLSELKVYYGSRSFFAGWDPNPRRVQQLQLVSPPSPSTLRELCTDDAAGLLTAPICSFLSSSLTKLSIHIRMVCFSKEQEDSLHLLASLQELEFKHCYNLTNLPAGLHKLTNLKRLKFCNCAGVRSLPKDGLPKSLQELDVSRCDNKELKQQCRGLVGTIPIIRVD